MIAGSPRRVGELACRRLGVPPSGSDAGRPSRGLPRLARMTDEDGRMLLILQAPESWIGDLRERLLGAAGSRPDDSRPRVVKDLARSDPAILLPSWGHEGDLTKKGAPLRANTISVSGRLRTTRKGSSTIRQPGRGSSYAPRRGAKVQELRW